MTTPATPSHTTALLLAAGQGTRMKSALPKVLHSICGRPLLHHTVLAALDAGCDEVIVVVGHGRTEVEAYLRKAFGDRVRTAVQEQQRGTGDAARAGMTALSPETERVLIFYGDVPLLTGDDLAPVVRALDKGDAALAVATCVVDDPFGYGRILRSGDTIVEIREQKDLRSDQERAIREINPGIYAAGVEVLKKALAELTPTNAQGEYYLTDIVAHAGRSRQKVVGVEARGDVLLGVNDRDQLAEAERLMEARIVKALRKSGVTVRDGARIEASVRVEPDATIESGAVLRGTSVVQRGAVVDVGCVLTDAAIGEGAYVKPYSVVTQSTVGPRAQVGPFAHLRPGSLLEEDVHVGNFVETKQTRMAKGAKANHLAYLGDGIVGEGANIGAGTIFCNYDGFLKHTTTIGRGAFIGSDSQLVAPVTIGENAYVGTGTTVTKDVPAGALAVGRARQENKEGYADRLRARLKAAKEAAQKAKNEGK